MSEVHPLVTLLAFAVLAAGITLILHRMQQRTRQFWRLERWSFYLLMTAMVMAAYAMVRTMSGGYSGWTNDRTTPFMVSSVLVWAWTVRVILLFNYKRFEREARDNPDHSCFACGYDLRGSRHSIACPECGAAIVFSSGAGTLVGGQKCVEPPRHA